jgi:hypothetical protein
MYVHDLYFIFLYNCIHDKSHRVGRGLSCCVEDTLSVSLPEQTRGL